METKPAPLTNPMSNDNKKAAPATPALNFMLNKMFPPPR
jgi:hypothetical protein